MFRTRTIFARVAWLCTFVSALGLILANTLFVIRMKESGIEQATRELGGCAENISDIFQENYTAGDTGEALFGELYKMAEYEKYVIWIADSYGNIIFRLTGDEQSEEYEAYFTRGMAVLAEALSQGKMSYTVQDGQGLFAEPIVTLGSPILVSGQRVGTVYLHTRLANTASAMRILLMQTLIAFAVCFAVAALGSLLLSKRVLRPLYDINLAAKALAKGDFSQRIEAREKGEIGQLVETFNMMSAELEKYENTRQSFVANVSHELKSPMTSIQGFVQGMLDGTIEGEDQKKYMEIVLSETKRLNILIGDLLDLAKIDSAQFPMHMTRWDLSEMLRRSLIQFIGKIEEKNLELAVNIPEEQLMVLADRDRIAQVVTNLLDNAVKFCEPHGTLKIWVYCADGKVHVNISNTGEIIPQQDLPFVFDRFFKVDKSHNRKSPGTGLGLSIVKKILLQHGQDIWVNSKPGMGTVFTFTLEQAAEEKKA